MNTIGIQALQQEFQQAGEVARMGLRILRGEPVNEIPVMTGGGTRFIFDHRALQRCNIPLSALPPDSIIKHRQYSVWQRYRPQIIAVLLTFGILLVLVAFLLKLTHQLHHARQTLAAINVNLEAQVQARTDELQHAHDELQEREALFYGMFDMHSAVMLLLDPANGRILDANQAAVDYYGYSLKTLQSMLIYTLNQLPREEVDRAMAQANTMECNEFEFRHRLANGEIRDVAVHSAPIIWRRQTLLFSIIHDITDRKQAENTLRESEERFRNIFEHSGAGIALSDLKGNILQVNPTFCAMLGYAETELVGQTFQTVSYPDDIIEETRQVLRVIAGETSVYQREKPYLHKNGQTVWGLMTVSVIRDATGAPVSVVGQVQDITEQKRIESALRESEERYRLLTENMDDVIWKLDLQGHFTYVSPSVERLRGYTPEEVMKQSMDEALTPDSLEIAAMNLRKIYEQAMSGCHNPYRRRYELKQPCKDGSIIWTEAVTSVMYDETGQFIGILGVTRDITDRKRMEAETLQAKEHAEDAERMKSTFFANVSHHLRTPLNAILGFADLMADDAALPPTYQEYLATIRQNGKELLALINRMLTVAKLDPDTMRDHEASQQLLAVLEDPIPQTTLSLQEDASLKDEDIETLRRALHAVPEDLCQKLAEATRHFDIGSMLRSIEEIRTTYPDIADALERLARNFEYDEILTTLHQIRREAS